MLLLVYKPVDLPDVQVCSGCVLFDVCRCDVYVCGVFEVVECSLFISSGSCMFLRVEWVGVILWSDLSYVKFMCSGRMFVSSGCWMLVSSVQPVTMRCSVFYIV